MLERRNAQKKGHNVDTSECVGFERTTSAKSLWTFRLILPNIDRSRPLVRFPGGILVRDCWRDPQKARIFLVDPVWGGHKKGHPYFEIGPGPRLTPSSPALADPSSPLFPAPRSYQRLLAEAVEMWDFTS